jgi:diacylglycerol kinase (ATP)
MRRKLLAGTAAASAAAASLQSYWSVRRLQQTRTPTASVNEPAPVAEGPQRVALVLNPSKLQADVTRVLVEEACADAGWEPPLILETTIEDPGTGQASQAIHAGADVVIAAGGDGTVRAVAQALAHQPAALGLLPLGTCWCGTWDCRTTTSPDASAWPCTAPSGGSTWPASRCVTTAPR